MPKKKIKKKMRGAPLRRAALVYSYRERVFNLFLNKFKNDYLEREEREFCLRKIWANGAYAAFRVTDEMVGYAAFAAKEFNMYNFPTGVELVNLRGVSYFPTGTLRTGNRQLNTSRKVEEPQVVLIYGQHSRQPIRDIVDEFIERIVDVEMTIQTNLIAQKLPILYAVMPENRDDMQGIIDSIMSDEFAIAVGVDTVDNIKSAGSNPPFIIDKLNAYKNALWGELLSFLGFDNMGIEKQERLIVDEANANNELTNNYENAVLDCLNEGADLQNEAFGTKSHWYVVEPEVTAVGEEPNNMETQDEKGESEDVA